jgi:endogenous inhibitor of DNA gyrase (YacG/DUF329 family)
MTQTEKERISKLRAEGLGATRIAKQLGLSVNTVKSYMRRTPVVETRPEPSIDVGTNCKQCGVPLSQHPHHKTKLFCSDACRMAWWSSHRSEIAIKTAVSLTCAYCGKPFNSYSSENRKYCSHACYINDRFGGERHDT